MTSPRTALRERVVALSQARRAMEAGRAADAERIVREELDRWPGNRDAHQLLAEIQRARGEVPTVGRRTAESSMAPPGARTQTDAWSSFEQRVRERRIARCAERAHHALAAGDAPAAQDAVDEIASLDPHHPALSTLPAPRVQPTVLPTASEPAPQLTPTVSERAADHETASWLASQPPGTGDRGLEAGEEPLSAPTARASAQPPETLGLRGFACETATPANPAETVRDAGLHVIDEMPLRADAPLDAFRPDSPPTRTPPSLHERGSRVFGVVLLVGSILALSAWGGHELFDRMHWQWPLADSSHQGAGMHARDDTAASSSQARPDSASQSGGPAVQPQSGTTGSGLETSRPGAAPVAPREAPVVVDSISRAPKETPPAQPVNPGASTDSRNPASPEPPSAPDPRPDPTDQAQTHGAGIPAAPIGSSGHSEESLTRKVPEAPSAASDSQAPTVPEPAPVHAPPPAAPPARTAAAEPGVAAATTPPTASVRPSPSAVPNAASAAAADGDEGTTSPEDAQALRGLIEGYMIGYNNLDAGGVQGVWPSVDRRALARAFDQLRSQHIGFSRCEVRTTGDTARGFCTGRASWVPRVGSRSEHTEQRVWRFEFGQRGNDWVIHRVTVER